MIQKLRRNNKGAALMLVLVAVALVTVLVTTMITASLINIQMKASERKGIENFYNADSYMDLVKTVVKTDANKILDAAYKELLINYKASASDATKKNAFYANFVNSYFKSMVGVTPEQAAVIQASGTSGNQVEQRLSNYAGRMLTFDGGDLDQGRKGYADFIETETEPSGSVKIKLKNADDWVSDLVKDGKLVVTIKGIEAEKDPYDVTKYTGTIWLRGVEVKYTDDYDYQTTVRTDMKIEAEYPNPNIKPDVLDPSDWVVVADGTLTSYVGGNDVNFEGNVCSISGVEVDKNVKTNFTSKKIVTNGAIAARNSGTINVNTESPIYSNGEIKEEGEYDAVWAKDIFIDGGTYVGEGNVYLADDLQFEHSRTAYGTSSATFKSASGETNNFIGYGTGKQKNALNNSAIIFNTDKFSLDMGGLNKLILTGNAFINVPVGTEADGTIKYDQISEGESISYKGLQTVYLVNTEMLGDRIKSNPVMQVALENEFNLATESVTDYITAQLNDYMNGTKTLHGINFTGLLDPANPFKYDAVTGLSGTQIYIFLNFKDLDSAKDYFRQYYNSDLNNDASGNNLIEESLAELNLSANLSLPNGGSSELNGILANYITSSGSVNFQYSAGTYKDNSSEVSGAAKYNLLFSKLLGSLQVSGQAGADVLNKISIYSRFANDTNLQDLSEILVNGSREANTANEVKIVAPIKYGSIYDAYQVKYYHAADTTGNTNDLLNGIDYNIRKPAIIFADSNITVNNNFYGLIVARGNVVIKKNFSGLVIAGGEVAGMPAGNVYYYDGNTYTYNKGMITNIMWETALGSYVADYIKFFKASTADGEIKAFMQDVKVTYDNWQENPE